MTMKKIFKSTLLLGFVTACNQTPFPQTGGNIKPAEDTRNPVAPAYSIEVAQILSCEEGKECVTPLVGHVPNGGAAVIRIDDLPEGAVYNQAEGKIHYIPGFDTVDVAKDPTQTIKSFVVTAILHADGDNVSTYQKQFSIEVKNTVRAVTIEADNANPRVVEGKAFSQLLTLTSEDFPEGPFYLNFQNQPIGLKVEPVDTNPRQFRLSYTPPFDLVTTADTVENGHYVKKFNMAVLVTTPSAQSTSQTLSWTVVDDRLAPLVSAPAEIHQGPIVNFTIRAEDPNGERAPTIQVDTNVPFGKLTAVKQSSNPGLPVARLPSTIFSVRWEDIPYDKIGQIQNISALICGPSTQDKDAICVNSTTKVEVMGNTHKLPTVSRTRWPVAKTNYFKVGASSSVALTVADAEDSARVVTVEILPESMRSTVSFRNGELVVKATTPGIQQFTIKATSEFQQSTYEGFIFEALPADWSDTVILTGSGITKEITALKDLTKSGDLLSSVFQINERNLQLRSRLIVTTGALAEAGALPFIEKAAAAIKNVIVLSPLAGEAGALNTELTGLGASVGSRITDAVGSYTVAVDTRSGLTQPQVPLGLKGNTTDESDRPVAIETTSTRKCKKLFSLQKTSVDISVGVSCQRSNGGVLSFVGFEFSDLVVTSKDSSTVGGWLDTLSIAETALRGIK